MIVSPDKHIGGITYGGYSEGIVVDERFVLCVPSHLDLDFCGEQNITVDIEAIPVQKITEAYDRLLKSDVKYRFSIDMTSLKSMRMPQAV